MIRHHARSVRIASIVTLTLAAACSKSSGSSDSTAAILVQFQAAAAAVPESGPAFDVAVRLGLTGMMLASDVTVMVSDAGTGTATSGVDHTSFAPVTVTFLAGAADGAVETVTLTPLADMLAEGDETVTLALSAPTGGAALGAVATVTVSIIDATPPLVRFRAPSSATVDESDGVHTVTVELDLDPGVSLDADVQVDVSDAGSGTATSGADYATFASQTLTFPALTADGVSFEVGVTVQDDGSLEGDETVVLVLSNASPPAALGAGSTHTMTITDDDASTLPFLVATSGEVGAETPLADGDTLDLGSQQSGTGPNAGERVTLANLGTLPMALSAPVLVGGDASDFSIEVLPDGLPLGMKAPPVLVAAPFTVQYETPGEGAVLSIDLARLAELAEQSRVLLTGVPIPGAGSVVLELERLPLPFTEDAVLLVDGSIVPGGPAALAADLSIWKGTVAGLAGSSAFLSFSRHGTRGWIRFDGSPSGELHIAALEGGAARVMWADQLPETEAVDPEAFCASALAPPGGMPDAGAGPAAPPGTQQLSAADCRLAIATDYQLFLEFGTVQGTTTYVTELIAALSDRYFTDVQTTISIAYLEVWSTAGDPWTTPDGGGDTLDMLNEFRDAWAPSNGGAWPVEADLAHFISGASLGGGIAYVNVLCSDNFGFGVSANINGNINWGTFTGNPASFTWDFVVVGHELGHNFGAQHTHSYCPPLDACQATCSGPQVCSDGTLMSYCHLCPGGMSNIFLEFHPHVANVIRTSVNSSCLGQSSLDGDDEVSYRVRFSPISGAGSKATTLRFVHDAANEASPFTVQLTGESLP